MIGNFVTIAFRNLKRHRFYTLVNLVGLVIGVTCFIVAALYLDYHIQFNAGHTKSDHMYRLIRHVKDAEGEHFDPGTKAVARHLEAEFPEVEHAVKVLNRRMYVSTPEGRSFLEWVAIADSTVMDVFDFQVLRGDAKTGLLEHGACFVTQSLAGKLFPDEDPVGKTVHVEFKWVNLNPTKKARWGVDFIQ